MMCSLLSLLGLNVLETQKHKQGKWGGAVIFQAQSVRLPRNRGTRVASEENETTNRSRKNDNLTFSDSINKEPRKALFRPGGHLRMCDVVVKSSGL